jgi:sulfate adenylyltransferase subunit 2
MNTAISHHHHYGHLDQLEAESIYILREVAAQFERPCILYSIGKDSSCVVHLARKAFYPGKIPFPLVHIDTTYDFPEMYTFRDMFVSSIGAELVVHKNEAALKQNANPFDLGTQQCCGLLRTRALVEGLRAGKYDAAIGGARRDEERSRAKERVFSVRDSLGQWDPRNQRPELWGLYNGELRKGESVRVFPLSNWTELDVWHYILREKISIVPLYLAKMRPVVEDGDQLIPVVDELVAQGRMPQGEVREIMCRFRTLGCTPCSGVIRSQADTVEKPQSGLLA